MEGEIAFWRIVIATLFGNFLTVIFLYGMYCISRAEKDGREEELGVASYLIVLTPLLIGAGGLYVILR